MIDAYASADSQGFRRRRAMPAPPFCSVRVVLALHHAHRQPQREDREGDHDHADHIAQRVFETDLRDAQVGLRRQQVGLAEYQRRAEIVEHLDEHQCRSGKVARHGERKHDPPEQAPAARAEVKRRFLHRPVDRPQRDDQVHQDERKVVQALDEDDPGEPLHDRDRETEVIFEQQIDRA